MQPEMARTDTGQRKYSDNDLGWVAFVRRLRATGMSMQRIREDTAMVRSGSGVLDSKITHCEAAERGLDVGCVEVPLRYVTQLG